MGKNAPDGWKMSVTPSVPLKRSRYGTLVNRERGSSVFCSPWTANAQFVAWRLQGEEVAVNRNREAWAVGVVQQDKDGSLMLAPPPLPARHTVGAQPTLLPFAWSPCPPESDNGQYVIRTSLTLRRNRTLSSQWLVFKEKTVKFPFLIWDKLCIRM